MKDFQKEGKLRRFLQTKTFLVFLGVVVIFFLYNIFNFTRKLQETRKNREIAEKNIEELESTKEKLQADIEKLNTERGVKESIREKFGLAEEGERLIMIVEKQKSSGSEEPARSNKFWHFITSWWK